MPDSGDPSPEGGFSSEDRGQTLEFGTKIMKFQAWRQFCYMFLTDTRRFEFYRITRLANGEFHYSQTATYTDREGWEILSRLCAQTDAKLGFVSMEMKGWALGATLGVGRTSVVIEASGRTCNGGVVKAYTEAATVAKQRRKCEYNVLKALEKAGVPYVPTVVPGSPAITATSVPVLFKSPRGYPAGTNHVFPAVVDFIPLVDTLQAVHNAMQATCTTTWRQKTSSSCPASHIRCFSTTSVVRRRSPTRPPGSVVASSTTLPRARRWWWA